MIRLTEDPFDPGALLSELHGVEVAKQRVVEELKLRPTVRGIDRLIAYSLAGASGEAHESLTLTVKCSKGTYIRTLGEDIGEALGCGAHLSALRRTATGGYDVSQCVTLAQLEAMTEDERIACLKPVDSLLAGHQAVTLDADNAGRFLSGVRRRGAWADCAQVAVYGAAANSETGRALLGSGHITGGELIPGRLLSPIEVAQSQPLSI